MTDAGATCWIDTYIVAPSRKWRAAVIDTASGKVAYESPSRTSEADARQAAAGWVEEQARLLVPRPAGIRRPSDCRRMIRPRGRSL